MMGYFTKILTCVVILFHSVQSYSANHWTASSSGKYLSSLDRTRRISKNSKGIVFDARAINKAIDSSRKEIEIDSIIININKMQHVYFNINNPNVALRMRKRMENIYYITEDGCFEKLSNNVHVYSVKIRNFMAYELNDQTNENIDCIIYNSQHESSTM